MRLGIGILAVLGLASCRPGGPTSDEPSDTSPSAAEAARIEPSQMMATIETLASDELGGRYSLHTDIDRAASVLIEKFVDTPRHIDEGLFPNKEADTDDRMRDFWKTNRGTPDNLRERPYANLYSRVTTQTNTWRIHFRVQTIRKGRSSQLDTFDPELDSIAAEQRGSSLVERYINPNDPDLPDFARDPEASLESEYQYREISTRRFLP